MRSGSRKQGTCRDCGGNNQQYGWTDSSRHTDGWRGYNGLESYGYDHEIIEHLTEDTLLPHVHTVISLIKRWIMGTMQGACSQEYLSYYLDEYTFRFNRRKSKSRGLLFYRLLQNAVLLEPVT